MAITKWGPQRNYYLAAAQPDLHLWGGIHCGRLNRILHVLPVHLR